MSHPGHVFAPQVEPLERRTKVVQLRADHLTFEQIGQTLGINRSTAKRDFDAAMADARERSIAAAETHKAAELAVLTAVRVKLLKILNGNHVHVSDGRVVRENGQAILDHGPNLAAARELRQLSERISKLLGLDAPSRRIVEVITEDAIDAELRRLTDEHAELTAGDGDTAR